MRTAAIVLTCALALAGGAARGDTPNATRTQTRSRTTAKTHTSQTITVKKAPRAELPGGWEPIGIVECDLYLSRLSVCMQSPTFPAEAKDSVKNALATARTGWKQIASQPAAASAANESCRQANEAMAQGADYMCPGVWPKPPQSTPPPPSPPPSPPTP